MLKDYVCDISVEKPYLFFASSEGCGMEAAWYGKHVLDAYSKAKEFKELWGDGYKMGIYRYESAETGYKLLREVE